MNRGLNDYWKFVAEEAFKSGDDLGLWIPPDHDPAPASLEGWKPNLNPTQQKLFDETAMVVLAAGEKASGKTLGLTFSGVRHCYENQAALWLIIVIYIATGAEGFWHDLVDFVLPCWRDGNKFPEWLDGKPHPRRGELMDGGIGLEYTETKLDPLTKDRHLWIANIHGGWSKVLMKSVPHPTQVEARMKGPSPSRILVEEITNCEGNQYFVYPSAQLNRRRGITGPQQFTASCNPAGPSHWVYREIVEPSINEDGSPNKDIAVYHVPITENLHNLPPDYQKRLDITLKNPYERRRLIDGEWIDTPAGDAIFREYFVPEIHVKGDALKGIGMMPLPGYPIIVGHDPGPKNYSIHLEQRIPTLDEQRPIIINVFDELNFVGKYETYDSVIRKLIRRLTYWLDHPKVRWKFIFDHIADEAAFTQRNSNGSFDNLEIQRIFARHKWPCRMRPCPKGEDSQPQRIQMVIDYLLMEALHVSAMCEQTLDMFRLLPSKKLKEGEYDAYAGLRPQKCVHLHPFDSMSYPMWMYHVRPRRTTPMDAVDRQRVIFAGSNSVVA